MLEDLYQTHLAPALLAYAVAAAALTLAGLVQVALAAAYVVATHREKLQDKLMAEERRSKAGHIFVHTHNKKTTVSFMLEVGDYS